MTSKPTEHDHYERIIELGQALESDLTKPVGLHEQIVQVRKHNTWLHELQEHTLACMEENDLALRGLHYELRGKLEGNIVY